jgi:hypothetical protein
MKLADCIEFSRYLGAGFIPSIARDNAIETGSNKAQERENLRRHARLHYRTGTSGQTEIGKPKPVGRMKAVMQREMNVKDRIVLDP